MVTFPSRLVTFPRCSLPQLLVQWENQDIDQFEVSGPRDIVGKKVEIHLFTVEVNAIHFFTNSSKQLERHEYSTLFSYANPCIIQSIFSMKVIRWIIRCINDICDFQIQDLSYSHSRTDDPCGGETYTVELVSFDF